jgi:protocatechuate 3,4-dioxygenase beta subunit
MPAFPRATLALAFLLTAACAAPASGPAATAAIHRPVPVIGHPCEGCEAVFDGMPAEIPSAIRLVPDGEPGVPMRISGRVLDGSGRARAGVVVYAYQTDHAGIYPRPARRLGREAMRHGRLRGWVRSDAQGRYAIDTIRPGSYPGEEVAEHVHMHVLEPGCFTYYIDDVQFLDDPKLSMEERRAARGIGGNGLLQPVMADGVWQVERDIVLGQGVPGHRECRAP